MLLKPTLILFYKLICNQSVSFLLKIIKMILYSQKNKNNHIIKWQILLYKKMDVFLHFL